MIVPVIAGVALLGAAAAGWIASRPAAYRYERSLEIEAPAAAAWELVSDFRNFPRWSPWQRLDPAMSTTFGGTQGAPGATYEWKGNNKVGRGRMQVVGVEPGQRVDIALEFFEPFASRADTSWIVEATDRGCRVRWVMSGQNDFMAKAFDVFMNMEKMLGQNFDEGLANLRRELTATTSPS